MNYIDERITRDDQFVCLIPEKPSLSYGPYTALEAMSFLAKQNATLIRLNHTIRFVSVPLVSL